MPLRERMSRLYQTARPGEQLSIPLAGPRRLSRNWIPGLCVLAFVLGGCASPRPTETCGVVATGTPSSERSACAAPRFAETGPNAEDYGASKGYPIGDRSNWFQPSSLVGSHSHHDQIFEGRTVPAAKVPSLLKRAAEEPVLRYEHQGKSFTLDDYLARNPATGLLVAQGETILAERYQ